ncbi:hypothetical protein Tco_0764073 [Tanacetum coccineum]
MIQDSAAYQTYFAFAIREATPKPKRIYKKTVSPTINTITKSPKETPSKKKTDLPRKDKKAPITTNKSKGIALLSEAALLEDAQIKKALKKSKRDTNIHQGNSRDDEESDDVSDDDGNDDDSDNDDDDNENDDVRTKSGDDKNDDDQEEEYVLTLENYESTDDEEEYEELYKDVNVRLRDVEHRESGQGMKRN